MPTVRMCFVTTVASDASKSSVKTADVRGERAERGFFRYLRDRLQRYQVAGNDLPFDFVGGFVGYFGYELKAECGGRAAHRSAQPDAAGLWVRRFLAVDHAER